MSRDMQRICNVADVMSAVDPHDCRQIPFLAEECDATTFVTKRLVRVRYFRVERQRMLQLKSFGGAHTLHVIPAESLPL